MAESRNAAAAVRTPRWRLILAWVLLVVATIIALLAAMDIWVKRQALDSGNWATTSSQLLQNDKIRQALSIYLVDQLYSNVNVQARLEKRLPPRLDPLAAPLAGALRTAATRGIDELLARPRVQQVWKEANRNADKLFIAVINDKSKVLQSTNGKVVLDLQPMIQQLAQQLGLGGKLTQAQGQINQLKQKLPPNFGRLVIMDAKQLKTAQNAVKTINAMSYFLGILVLALYALAVYLVGVGRRRRMLMSVGFALLSVGILILAVRRLAGNWITHSLTKNVEYRPATSAAWEIGTHLLRNVATNILVYGIAFILAAWIAGPSRPAVAVRRWLAPTLRHRPVLVYAVVTAALLIFLATGPTDSSRLIPLLVLFAFAYLGVELFRRQTAREFPEAPAAVSSA